MDICKLILSSPDTRDYVATISWNAPEHAAREAIVML